MCAPLVLSHDGGMTEAPSREPAAPPRVLRRSSEGRFLMGVCAGLARHTGIDPVVFRVGFVILLFGSGIGLFLYIAAYLLMKEPSGRPGLIEQWTHRDFDADTVMALLTAVLALGLGINLSTVWLDTGTLVAGLFLAVALLAAHAHGVDLMKLARSMPERLNRRPAPSDLDVPAGQERVTDFPPPPSPPVTPQPSPRTSEQPAAERPAATAAHASVPPETREEPLRPYGVQEEDAPGAPGHDGRTRVAPAYEPAEPADPAEPPVSPAPAEPEPITYRQGGYGTGGYDAHERPFAPHGPYQPLDPAKRTTWSPYDPALYDPARFAPPPAPRPVRPRQPRSFIGAITILLATIIGGIIVAVQAASPSGVQPTVVGGAVLVTLGAGLLIAAWWGKGAGLVAAGTMVALLIGVGLMFGGLPAKVGSSVWVPTTIEETRQVFDVGVGDGELDLTELTLKPGSTLEVDVAVTLGTLEIVVPPDTRLEVHATNKVGDIQVDQSLRGGVDVKLDKVLEPDVKPEGEPATIVLNIEGGVGDVEVRRGA